MRQDSPKISCWTHLGAGEDLLAATLAARWSPRRLTDIPSLAVAVTETQWAQALAVHGLAGVLLRHQSSTLEQLPPVLQSTARELAAQSAATALAQIREFVAIHQALAAAGVEHVPFKGIFLSLDLYGDPAVRRSTDIDVLIDPQDLNKADPALRRAGFTSQHAYDGSADTYRALMRSSQHLVYRSPVGHTLELHWRTDPSPRLSLPPLKSFVGELPRVRLGPVCVPTLSGRRLLQSTAAHALRSCCYSWKWGYDVLELHARSRQGRLDLESLGPGDRAERLCLHIMQAQLALNRNDEPLPGAAKTIGSYGVRRRLERIAAASLSPGFRGRSRLVHYQVSWILENSMLGGLQSLWSLLLVSSVRNPARSRFAARFPGVEPLVGLWTKLQRIIRLATGKSDK